MAPSDDKKIKYVGADRNLRMDDEGLPGVPVLMVRMELVDNDIHYHVFYAAEYTNWLRTRPIELQREIVERFGILAKKSLEKDLGIEPQ